MSREIRRVPPNWIHPRYHGLRGSEARLNGQYIGLYDQSYDEACSEWLEQLDLWRSGAHPRQAAEEVERLGPAPKYYWDYHVGPPSSEHYRSRTWSPQEATHYQVYETVTEGTPASPIFATLEEVEDFLVSQGYSLEAARAFCHNGWVPTAAAIVSSNSVGAYYDDIKAPQSLYEERF